MKKLILILAMCMSMTACGQRETVVVQQPVVAQQPVYVQNHDPMTGVLAGMAIGSIMSNGMRYDGHNGYEDNRYRGPSRTIIVNKTVVNNVPTTPAVANAPMGTKPGLTNAAVAPVSQKVKNPGDAAADAERIKMANEASLKADRDAKQATLKANLQAKQAARASAPAAKSGGFNSMSKSASSSSTKRK